MNDDLKTKRIINNLTAFLDRALHVRISNKALTHGEKYMCCMAVAEKADEILADLADSQDSIIRESAEAVSERAHEMANGYKPKKADGLCIPATLKEWFNDAIKGDAYMVRLCRLITANELLTALEKPTHFANIGWPPSLVKAAETLTSEEIYASALVIKAYAEYHVNNFRNKKDHGATFMLRTLNLLEKANNVVNRHKPIGKSDLTIPNYIQKILRKEDMYER